MPTRTRSTLLALPLLTLATLALVPGCGTRGSGTAATQTRELDGFEKIEVSGAVDLVVHVQPDAAAKAEVTADDNLVDMLETKVVGGALDVGFADGSGVIRPKVEVRVEVWVPKLSALSASGATDVEVEGVDGERFELASSGASDLTLRGAVDELTIDISGAGDVHARALQAKRVDIDSSGAAEVEVSVSELLDVDMSGSGEVSYWGSPGTVNQQVSGSGEVKKRG